MKLNWKEKLFYGYIGGAAVLSIAAVVVSLLAKADWHSYLLTPGYLYQRLLFVGIALQEWMQAALAGVLLCGQVGGALLAWRGQTKWAMALILPPLILHTVFLLLMLL